VLGERGLTRFKFYLTLQININIAALTQTRVVIIGKYN